MPFAWVLEPFLPLLKKWQTWVILVLVALIIYILSLRGQLAAANAALAARPAIHTEAEQKTQIVRVAGPVHYETKTVFVPGTNTVQYVDRIITRDPVTTTTEKETEVKRDEKPACPPLPAAPWRYAGAVVDPLAQTKLVGLRGGVTLYDRLDLGAAFRTQPNLYTLEAGIRF